MIMEKQLIKFSDGYMSDIQTEHSSYSGCETCDYGSKYINELTFVLSKRNVTYHISNMYDYAVSEGWLMQTILPRICEIQKMSEDEFITWIKNELSQICHDRICYGKKEYGVTVEINDR